MLRAEIFVDILVEFLVGSGRLSCVKIAPACDIAVGRVEIESAGYGLELLDWEVLRSGDVSSAGDCLTSEFSRSYIPLTFMLAARCDSGSLHELIDDGE